MTTPEVVAIVVTFNSSTYISRLLDQLTNFETVSRVVVFDNASTDDSVAVVSSYSGAGRVRLIRSQDNLGFGAAVNRAIDLGRDGADFIAVINPDVGLEDDLLERLLPRFSDKNLAAVGVQLTRSDGAPVSSARQFPSRMSVLKRTAHEVAPGAAFMEVDWICGAFMLWRFEAFSELGGFSPQYFLYYEDVDICRKAWAQGWRVAIAGAERAIHDQGHGAETSAFLKAVNRQSRRRYATEWLGRSGAVVALAADLLEISGDFLRKMGVRS